MAVSKDNATAGLFAIAISGFKTGVLSSKCIKEIMVFRLLERLRKFRVLDLVSLLGISGELVLTL
jgi:hypothetical protein